MFSGLVMQLCNMIIKNQEQKSKSKIFIGDLPGYSKLTTDDDSYYLKAEGIKEILFGIDNKVNNKTNNFVSK